MANEKHLSILLKNVASWNEWRQDNPKTIPELSEANLSGMDLIDANLSEADLRGTDLSDANLLSVNLHRVNLAGANIFDANLGGADLSEANLSGVDLSGANLSDANLCMANLNEANLNRANLFEAQLVSAFLSGAALISADLFRTNLNRANLYKANLFDTQFSSANLSEANLREANLKKANIFDTNLFNADLSGADLIRANLKNINLDKANLHGTRIGWTVFARIDLNRVQGLSEVIHKGPCTIGTDTIQKSRGNIPPAFLRRCGLSPWEIELARLHDLSLPKDQISRILNSNVVEKRTPNRIFSGGIFICYADADAEFVEKLYEHLDNAGASVWLDNHDPADEDIPREVRIRDVVVLVLSQSSIETDWVHSELDISRKKSKDRDVLCAVTLDDTWKEKADISVSWWQLKKTPVLDFSGWATGEFSSRFEELLDQLMLKMPLKSPHGKAKDVA